LVAVVGPTASGKSSLALELTRRFGGEVVNCDSLQLYRGLDVGTAKPTPEERAAVPHHLFDLLDPAEVFSAGEYAARARDVIGEIAARGRLPVLTGGTGFYLRALLEGLPAVPTADPELRRRLLAREARRPGLLPRLLRRLDPAAAGRIHARDVQKTLRAVEICLRARQPASRLSDARRGAIAGFCTLLLGLNPPRAELHNKIAGRTHLMFAGGIFEEIQSILASGVPVTAKAFEAIGYRQALAALAGSITPAAAEELTAAATRQYAKRQLTWFRRERNVVWLNGFGDDPAVRERAVALVAAGLAEVTNILPPATEPN
jgi:tRNA dimethylallyltransferase